MGNHTSKHELLARIIRKHIPSGREADVAELLNVSERTIEGWRYGDNPPKGLALLELFGVLGPDFQNEVTALVGIGGAHYLNAEVCERKFLAVTANVAAEIAKAQADGHTDHNEARRILQAMEPLVADAPHVAHRMRKKAAAA